jgi:hypothetical protein
MKRLKMQCPFGGKKYPPVAAGITGLGAATFCGLQLDLPADSCLTAMLLAVIVVLLLCYVFENRLTPAEQKAIARSEFPLWLPVTADIISRVRSIKRIIDPKALICGIGCIVLGLLTGAQLWLTEGEGTVCKAVVVLGIGILVFGFVRCMIWRSIDDTAVYTFIPIDHMYDVTHHHKDGDYTLSYLVFYLPDGKYVLRARSGSGDYGAIAVVKYRHLVTWVSVPRTVHVAEREDLT